VLAGVKPGLDGLGARYLGRLLKLTTGARVVTVPLVDQRYAHLDTAVGVLGSGRFLVHLDALAEGRLPAEGPLAEADVVAVSASDARRFACNVVLVGDVVVMGPVSDGLRRRIQRLGLHVEQVDLGEFYKAGGGAKCLTLPLRPRAKGEADERASEPRVERLLVDKRFLRRFRRDPEAALAPLGLTAAEVEAVKSGDSGRLLELGLAPPPGSDTP
jgi:hypothetical protein